MPMGSNESIPCPGSFFNKRLSLGYRHRQGHLLFRILEHLDDQERKRKKNVGQKGKLKETKEKVTRTENKGRRKDQYQGKKTNWLQKATVQSP